MSNLKTKIFWMYALLVEIVTLSILIASPSDIENQFFMGFSLNRWILLVVLLILFIVTLGWERGAIQKRQKKMGELWNFIFPPVILLFTLILFLSLAIIYTTRQQNYAFIPRLIPLVWMFFFLSLGYEVHVLVVLQINPWQQLISWISQASCFISQLLRRILAKLEIWISALPLTLLVLFLTFPLIFIHVIQDSYPIGYAGLYTQISNQLAANGFQLPFWVPFYGPGGIPLAYPPFAFYLMGFTVKILGISQFAYLRFAAPLFLWIAMPFLANTTFQLSRSKVATVIAPMIVLGMPGFFIPYAEAGGMVRGLALLFVLIAINSYLQTIVSKRLSDQIITGVFIGLTGLTHLGLLEFLLIFIAAISLLNLPKKEVWRLNIIAGLVSILIAMPWVLVVVSRYGMEVFNGAMHSHENDYFLYLFSHPEQILPSFQVALQPILDLQYLWGITFIGLCYTLFRRKAILPIWFLLLIILYSQGNQLLIIPAGIVSALILGDLWNYIRIAEEKKNLTPISSLLPVTIILILFLFDFQQISNIDQAFLDQSSDQLAEYITCQTSPDATYLFVSSPEEAEWYPYLFQRTPVIGSWGAEWLGTYRQQLGYVLDVERCQLNQSATCLIDFLEYHHLSPDLIITSSVDVPINQALSSIYQMELRYQNDRYIVWQGPLDIKVSK